MRTFDEVWSEAVRKYGALKLKGAPALMGTIGDYEVCYIHFDDCIELARGATALEAAEKFLVMVEERVALRKAELRHKYESDLRELEG